MMVVGFVKVDPTESFDLQLKNLMNQKYRIHYFGVTINSSIYFVIKFFIGSGIFLTFKIILLKEI